MMRKAVLALLLFVIATQASQAAREVTKSLVLKVTK